MGFRRKALLRSTLAFGLGTAIFTMGLYRLVVLSTGLTIGVLRGESPAQALLKRRPSGSQ